MRKSRAVCIGAPSHRGDFVTVSPQTPTENAVDARREAARARFVELRSARSTIADADLDAVWALSLIHI